MNDKQKLVASLVLIQLAAKNSVTTDDIEKYINDYANINQLPDNERMEVLQDVQARLKIKIDKGILITEKNHKP